MKKENSPWADETSHKAALLGTVEGAQASAVQLGSLSDHS